jgi:hypothetical protein
MRRAVPRRGGSRSAGSEPRGAGRAARLSAAPPRSHASGHGGGVGGGVRRPVHSPLVRRSRRTGSGHSAPVRGAATRLEPAQNRSPTVCKRALEAGRPRSDQSSDCRPANVRRLTRAGGKGPPRRNRNFGLRSTRWSVCRPIVDPHPRRFGASMYGEGPTRLSKPHAYGETGLANPRLILSAARSRRAARRGAGPRTEGARAPARWKRRRARSARARAVARSRRGAAPRTRPPRRRRSGRGRRG